MITLEELRHNTIEKLGRIDNLPALPGRFHKLQEILGDTSSSLADLARVIEQDQAITATILKIANSIYYNPLGKPVSNVPYAISRLGRKEAGDIALSMALLSGIPMPANIIYIQQFWTHAFITGQISRYISTTLSSQYKLEPDTIYVSSLLHDIGRAILAICIDADYFKKDMANLHGNRLIEAEQRHYGIDHAEAGAMVLRLWKLPPEIYTTVGEHHNSETEYTPAKICAFATQFAHQNMGNLITIEDAQNKLKSHEILQKITHSAKNNLILT